jgi:hypothetical protein
MNAQKRFIAEEIKSTMGDGYEAKHEYQMYDMNDARTSISAGIISGIAGMVESDMNKIFLKLVGILGHQVAPHIMAAALGQSIGSLVAMGDTFDPIEHERELGKPCDCPACRVGLIDITKGLGLKSFAETIGETVNVNVHAGHALYRTQHREDLEKERNAKRG